MSSTALQAKMSLTPAASQAACLFNLLVECHEKLWSGGVLFVENACGPVLVKFELCDMSVTRIDTSKSANPYIFSWQLRHEISKQIRTLVIKKT